MSLNRKHWTLLALASAEGRPLSPVQLQKSLFLLGREMAGDVGPDYYQFEPYNYGPFDLEVYRDAERLAREGLVAIDTNSYLRYNEYRATPRGLEVAVELIAQAPTRAADYLRRVVEWARGLGFAELVSAIYSQYPEMRVNSVFRG